MHCRIHVRYARNVDIPRVAGGVLALWDGTRRPRLCHVPASGRLIPATEGSLREALEFSADHVAGVTIRHRRRNKDTDSVHLHFSEPGHETGKDDAGSCHVCFYHDRVERSEPGYTPGDLVEIMAGLVAAGPVSEAYCFGGEPFDTGDFREVSRRAVRADAGTGIFRSLWWLTLVPPGRVKAMLAELTRLEIEYTVVREIHGRGSIVSLSPQYPGNSPEFHDVLRTIRLLSPEEETRAWVLDLENLAVFRLAGKALEIEPFPFAGAGPGKSPPGPDAAARYGELAAGFVTGTSAEGPMACHESLASMRLDFSRDSLAAFAEYLRILREHRDEVGVAELNRALLGAGAYFGEVARRCAPAHFRWLEFEDWTRLWPGLAPRLRATHGRHAALVSEALGVARPFDHLIETFASAPARLNDLRPSPEAPPSR